MNISRLAKFTALSSVLLTIAGLGYYLYYNTFYRLDLNRRVRHEAEVVVQSAFLMCEVTDRLLQKRQSELSDQVSKALSTYGSPVQKHESWTWSVFRPESGIQDHLSLPLLQLENPRGGDRNLYQLGEAIIHFTGGEVTILQRVNMDWDQLRVFCSMGNVHGPEDPTEIIPAKMTTGERETCFEKLERGETVLRPEFINGHLILSYYHPFSDGKEVLGTIIVRVADPNLERLRTDMIDLRMGETGYVYALKATGMRRGQYIISFNGERDGECIWNSTDASGRPFIQRMIAEALTLRKNRDRISVPIAYERYPWKNPGEHRARYKTAAVVYFEPWDWVIGAGYYEDER